MAAAKNDVRYEQYALKATFFYEKLESYGFFDLFGKVKKLSTEQSKAYTWNNRSEWGISEDAWSTIEGHNMQPLLVFCHPKLLKGHPTLLRYYRSVALIPQKGLKLISGYSSVERVEEGNDLPEDRTIDVVKAINNTISLNIELANHLDEEKIKGMMFATAGTQIDGSWRNQIGSEGEL